MDKERQRFKWCDIANHMSRLLIAQRFSRSESSALTARSTCFHFVRKKKWIRNLLPSELRQGCYRRSAVLWWRVSNTPETSVSPSGVSSTLWNFMANDKEPSPMDMGWRCLVLRCLRVWQSVFSSSRDQHISRIKTNILDSKNALNKECFFNPMHEKPFFSKL